jgi:hypothetical protein
LKNSLYSNRFTFRDKKSSFIHLMSHRIFRSSYIKDFLIL